MRSQLSAVKALSAPHHNGHSLWESEDEHDGEHDPVSVAKLTMIGTLGAAAITGTLGLVAQFGLPHLTEDTKDTPSGISYDYTGDYAKSEVAVNGSATDDIDAVAVLVSPRSSGGDYWVGKATVIDGAWDVTVRTDPRLPKPYEVQAIPHYGQRDSAATTNTVQPYSFIPGDTSTPPLPPPEDPLVCAVHSGASCFDGPGWGTPVVHQSDG